MFQLETEVRKWCKRAIPFYWLRPSYLAEMEDHLLCGVERLTKDGTSTEKAFYIATDRLGETTLLRVEFRKNTRHSLRHSLQLCAKVVATGCAVLMVLASIGGADVTAWSHNLFVAICDFPFFLLDYFT